jgi:hypothetical protein
MPESNDRHLDIVVLHQIEFATIDEVQRTQCRNDDNELSTTRKRHDAVRVEVSGNIK